MTTLPVSVESSASASKDLQQKFRRLRRSFLFWKAVNTISSTLVGLFVVASFVVLLDYVRPMPWQARLFIVASVSAIVLSVIYQLVWFVLCPPRYSDLARSLRTDRTQAQSNLIAASMLLEDSEVRRQPLPCGSEQALAYAVRTLDGWQWHRSVRRSGPLGWLGLCLLIAAGLSWMNIAPHMNLMSHRWLSVVKANSDADYLLRFIDPPQAVYAGQSLQVEVQAFAPLDGNIVTLSIDGSHQSVTTLPSSVPDRFRFEIKSIESTLTVTATASPTVYSRPITIPLRKSIAVLSHRFAIDPPVYLGQSKYESDKKEVTVTQNSKMTLSLELSDLPDAVQLQASVQGAELLLRGKTEPSRRVVFDLSDLTQRSKLALSERGEQQLVYRFATLAADDKGQGYSLNYPLVVSVQSDAYPEFENIKIVSSEPSNSPMSRPALQGTVRDDFGLEVISIEFQGIATQSNQLDETLQDLKPLIENEAKSLTQVIVNEGIDVERLMQLWPTCDAIDVSLIAVDSAGQKARSIPVRITVFEENQPQGKTIQEIRSVLEKQQHLQQQTTQASQLNRLPEQMLRKLVQDQQAILDEFQASIRDDGDRKLQQAVKSIENLMQASVESIERTQLVESESLQKVIVEKLRDLARQSQSLPRKQDAKASKPSDLQHELAKWNQRQDEAVKQISEALKDQSSDLASIAAVEQALQQDITEHLNQMDEASSLHWPLKHVTTLLSRTTAKLQRNRRDISSMADAQFAADILRSLSNLASSNGDAQQPAENGDKESNQEKANASVALEELRVLRDLQMSLKERLESLDVDSNLPSIQLSVRELASQQRLLLERTAEIVQQLKE